VKKVTFVEPTPSGHWRTIGEVILDRGKLSATHPVLQGILDHPLVIDGKRITRATPEAFICNLYRQYKSAYFLASVAE
jgi:hypothetical protein